MTVRLLHGDCLELLTTLEPESVHSVICDPPYHLKFMSMGWDSGNVAFQVGTWHALLRVLKPGGHLISFGGTRTYHRMAVAVEDAGFEVRDQLGWAFGGGMPKSRSGLKPPGNPFYWRVSP